MDKIRKLEKDIKAIRIQGATNVALATLEGIRQFASSNKDLSGTRLKNGVLKVGSLLSGARENEPLARNAVKYLRKELGRDEESIDTERIFEICDQYESLIQEGKISIVSYGTEVLREYDVVLNHCHSSTAITILKNVAQFRKIKERKFRVVATETRPLYQGRLSAKELLDAGVRTTLIVDSVCASFITDDRYVPVDAVVVGCDEILGDGSIINKVGTFSIALAAQKGCDNFYVATTLLKLEHSKNAKNVDIEQRAAEEIWKEAPRDLEIINPAFELIRQEFITGYITEVGVLKPKDLMSSAKKFYPWLFD
ncbi:MAG: hypothetical protein PHS44_08125 [Candidatus Dojkabacteria bacterium]|nr:hypothetical protein [Candidatus Dojkabacteria bacterium]